MSHVEDIKAYRISNQCSLQEASRVINKRDKLARLTALRQRCNAASSVESLACILRQHIEETMLEVSFL